MKKVIKAVIITAVIIGIGVGAIYFAYNYNRSKKIAEVVPMTYYGMDGYWGDSITSYGEVTSDKAQTFYLNSGTEVISVNVAEGDFVNEGDVIMTVKKDSLDLDGMRLSLAKDMQAMKVSQIKLDRLLNTTPSPNYVAHWDVTKEYSYIGSKAYYVKSDASEFSDGYEGTYKPGDKVAEQAFDIHGNSLGWTYYIYHRYTTPDDNNEIPEPDMMEKSEYLGANDLDDTDVFEIKSNTSSFEFVRYTYYSDAETGKIIGEIVYDIDGNIEKEKKPPTGPTAKELAEQIEDAKSELKRKELAVRIGQSKLEEMENTDTSGNIKATVSGTITNLQSPDNYNSTKPFFIVTATDEYYISAMIGEFYLDSINVGDVVDIMSWETGLSAQATIVSVSDSPSDDGNYYGGGNSNSSSYEFKASFDKSSGIEIGSTVDVTINPSGQASSSLYIPSQFVREDSSGTYVMRKNDKNKLEKVYFSAGKTLWGSMIEVKDGVSINDYLAFPYGNGAIEGIECKEVESLTY